MPVHPAANNHLHVLIAENDRELFRVVIIHLQDLSADFLFAIYLYDHDPLTVPEPRRDSRAVEHDSQLHDGLRKMNSSGENPQFTIFKGNTRARLMFRH